MCVVLCCVVLARLTQAAAVVAGHGHEGPQAPADDAVRPAERRLLEGAGVLVQEGVHAVGGGGSAIPHEGLCSRKTRAAKLKSMQETGERPSGRKPKPQSNSNHLINHI